MSHETALIATIGVGIALALFLGLVATRLRLPPLVGYLLAGVAIGPFTPGFVGDAGLAGQLAEIGVILLMFGVGIHFSVADLLSVRRIALPGAVVQIAVATVLGAAATRLWGWSLGSGIVFGLCLSVASTVVLLRALEDRRMVDSVDGRIAVGWLIVEDLATVVVLVLLPALSGLLGGSAAEGAEAADGTSTARTILLALGLTFAKVGAFVALTFLVGRRAVPWLLQRVANTGSRELFTLAVLAVALGIAAGAAALFGVSFALGAFFAGMVVNGSPLSHAAARDSLPLQDAFAVLFFVAVGMLFDPTILLRHPIEVLTVVLIVIVGKAVAALVIVLVFRYPVRTALTISASLAQIGEFSFILAALARTHGLLPPEGQSLIVAAALLSISLNPVAFRFSDWAGRWIMARPRLVELLERPARPAGELSPSVDRAKLRDHVILVGFGRVGGAVSTALERQKIPFVVVEENRGRVEDARKQRRPPLLYGDATRRDVLDEAGVAHASMIIVTVPDPFHARTIIENAYAANRSIATVVRTHSESERAYLESHGVGLALVGEKELAIGLAHHAILVMGGREEDADAAVDAIRSTPRPHQPVRSREEAST
ncbi:MAG: Kef family K(+) transporter [Labilithrix sp.]|nr:Kef family K(+) transporter [Labilithrix sp.]